MAFHVRRRVKPMGRRNTAIKVSCELLQLRLSHPSETNERREKAMTIITKLLAKGRGSKE
ncbi:hypothetical protein V1477_014465 [Vespula maculifrons]|uniref:Uncharacterized protein n=1 Tax=Vespula maculifrons TaxID=7453 RepID=A0ABD2BL40_VESMC